MSGADQTNILTQTFLEVSREMKITLEVIKTKVDNLPSSEKVEALRGNLDDLYRLYHSLDMQRFVLNITDLANLKTIPKAIDDINKKLEELDTIQKAKEHTRFYSSIWFKLAIQIIITAGTIITVMDVNNTKEEIARQADRKEDRQIILEQCIQQLGGKDFNKLEK